MNSINQPVLRNQSLDLSYIARNLESPISLKPFVFPIKEIQGPKELPTQPSVVEQEDKQLQQVRKILGEIGKDLTTQELQTITTEFQFLVNSWLDSYEKLIFKGLTLQQLLNERGHL